MTPSLISCAHLVFDRTKALSIRVNKELLEPISHWIDDPDFMARHKVAIDQEAPNWAEYKRKQREWSALQRMEAAERLRSYWQDIRKRKSLKRYIQSLIPKSGEGGTVNLASTDYLSAVVAPFSPPEMTRQETLQLFEQARSLSMSNLLPWRLLIAASLDSPKSMSALPQYADRKTDKVAKLQTLLQLDMERKLTISQDQPFGDITITPAEVDEQEPTELKIKDQQGTEYTFDWADLSDAQRNKVIADIKDRRIVCRVM